MAKQIFNTSYKSEDGTPYRLEVWDNANPVPSLGSEVELGPQGFDLQWEGEEGDPSPAFLPSSMTLTMYMNPTQRSEFSNAVWGDKEYNGIVRLYRTDDLDNEKLLWAGAILPESVTEVIEDGYVQVSMKATDGLTLLKEINFVDDALARYDGEKTAVEWIYECLKKVPTHPYLFTSLATQRFIEERMIMRPVTDAQPTFPDSDAVLDTMFVHANSLYSVRVEEAREREGFEQRKAPKNTQFVSTYEVLYNIIASMGATLCLGEGTWQLFDRERIINLADDAAVGYFSWFNDGGWFHTVLTNETALDFDALDKNLRLGATRSAQYPIAAAVQKHSGAGSDLIWRSGDGWIWTTSQFEGRRPTVTQYTGASSGSYNNSHLWIGRRGEANADDGEGRTVFFRGDVGAGASAHTQQVGSLDGDMLNNPADGVVNGIQLATGDDDGRFSFAVGGNVTFRGSGPTVNSNLPVGTTGLYRQYLEVSDGTNSFRFRRRMRTYPYFATGGHVAMAINNSGSANKYVPRYYETGFWVRDDDARYETAYLDIMLGCDESVLDTGETDVIAASSFPNTVFYSPPRTRVSADTDFELVRNDDDKRQHFDWSFRAQIIAPTVAEGATPASEFTSIKVWNPRYIEVQAASKYAAARNSSGTAIDVPLTEALDDADIDSQLAEAIVAVSGGAAYRSATDSGLTGKPAEGSWNATEKFELSGMHIYMGDGTEEWDVDYYANMNTPIGSEFMPLNTTALGATYVNSGNRTFGRWKAEHPLNPSVREDNLKFMRYDDGVSVFTSMGQMVAQNALEVRGEIRQIVNGTVITNGAEPGVDFLVPYRAFKTSKYGAGVLEKFVPMRVSMTGEGWQELSAILCGTWTPKPSTTEDHAVGFTGGIEPNSGTGPHEPGGVTSLAWNKVTAVEDVTEHFDASGMTGSIPITEIQDKIDKVQTTNPITDDDLGGGGSGLFGDIFPIFIKRF